LRHLVTRWRVFSHPLRPPKPSRAGWPLLDDGRPSNKLSLATVLGISIVSERRFLEWAARARRSLKFCEIQLNSLAHGPGSQVDSNQPA
jgi:hypothetical protein